MANVLVVGGAGYVGSATCAWLIDAGHTVTVLDNLSTGQKDLVLGASFHYGSAGDLPMVIDLLIESKIDCVFHFAAKSVVSESVRIPQEYYDCNVNQTRLLLDAMAGAGVKNIVFSSTCAVFGDPGGHPITEDTPKNPQSPYGATKLEVEMTLETYARDKGLRAIALRYFNAAGAEPSNRVGEWHDQETHLIPSIFRNAQKDEPICIYGTDYPTPDGTCIRDYIHVWDLAEAHGAAMQKLLGLGSSDSGSSGFFGAYNLGSQNGFSVREVILAAEEVLGKKLKIEEKPRRAGDPAVLISRSSLAEQALGFKPGKSSLRMILESAWKWEQKRQAIQRPAVFLDRDGTINDDPGYLNHPDQMKLLPGVGVALARLKAAGYRLIVASNQSGVGRGLIDPKVIPAIHDRLQNLLKPYSVSIDHFALCFHHPDENCDCRKPQPGLILGAARQFNIDMKRSFMVGDKPSDIEVGFNAKLRGSLLVLTGDGQRTSGLPQAQSASFVGASLADAVDWVLAKSH